MLANYRPLLALPEARRFFVPGILIRMPMSMLSVAAIMAYTGLGGSYTLGGALMACIALPSAAAGPMIARLADSHGQTAILRVTWTTHLIALAALTTTLIAGAPYALTAGAAIATGATYGSMGAMVRARWVHVIRRHHGTTPTATRALDTVFALEAVADELVFVIGPIVAVALSTSTHPVAGLLAAGTFLATGGVLFLTDTTSRPTPAGTTTRRNLVLTLPGVWALVILMMLLGATFGAIDISVVAALDDTGRRNWAGATLACFAAGSMASGIWFGAITWTNSHPHRLIWAFTCYTLCLLPTIFTTTSWWLMLTAFIGGLGISPALTTAVSLIKDLVPEESTTEAVAWLSTSTALGVAASVACVGRLMDVAAPVAGFYVLCGLAATGTVLAVSFAPIFMRATTRLTEPAHQ